MTRAALAALVTAAVAAAPAHAGRPTAEPSERAAPASSDPGYRFARSLALAGPRAAGSPGERRAQGRVAARFRAGGLRVGGDAFPVPGHGRSRNVVGVWDAPADCLIVLLAHVDSGPAGPGADDNASGVGVLAAVAPRLRALQPRCDVWLISTGAEERGYTGQPDHLGALAAVRRVRRLHRASDLRFALSLDEVGRGRTMLLRSPVPAQRASVERAILRAGRGTGLRVSWQRDSGTGNSDHREFELAGLPGAKLGVPDEPCRELACDRASLLDAGTFPRVRRLVEQLLGG
jgi:peptidase M28-like protein